MAENFTCKTDSGTLGMGKYCDARVGPCNAKQKQ
jgi:hypothetical protein